VEDVPIIIGGKEYRTEDVKYQVMVRRLKKYKHQLDIRGECVWLAKGQLNLVTLMALWPKAS